MPRLLQSTKYLRSLVIRTAAPIRAFTQIVQAVAQAQGSQPSPSVEFA
jgi:hypothetical protein